MNKKEIAELIDRMREKKLRIVTAESLTCGMIAAALTEVPGASDVVSGGFGVYTNAMKNSVLGVSNNILDRFTAVSAPVARLMAVGAMMKAEAQIAVAVTGYAGSPRGQAADSDSGLVYIAVASKFNDSVRAPHVRVQEYRFAGDRAQVRRKTVDAALRQVRAIL